MRKNIYLGIVQNLKRAVYDENKVFYIYPDTLQLNAAIEAASWRTRNLTSYSSTLTCGITTLSL